ncbi:MAG: response regulator, partial [Proteobacteria bacterium]
FSLVQFLAEFSSFAALKAREHGLSFEFTAESLIPDLIVSDPSKLRQILSNSVGNAVKFTERGKVKLTVSYDDNQLTFKISDTGRGISAEQRSHLFQAFAQVDSSTTRKFGGTGLGLILTKKLSEVLGGDYNLRSSEPGKGSTFVASLPISLPEVSELVPVDALAARISEKPLADSVPDISDMKVLLVEDSPDNQVLVKLMLSKVGIDLEIVGDGASGVKSALNEHFDIVLMDIQMPLQGFRIS